MTPAIKALERANIPFKLHPYEHDPADEGGFGLEAAHKLHVEPTRIFKTLVARLDDPKNLVVAVVPVAAKLSLKAIAAAVGAKKADMADPAVAEKATGYVVGGISPLGTRKVLPTVIDESALQFETIYLSAGRRGLQLELSPGDLVRVLRARTWPIAVW